MRKDQQSGSHPASMRWVMAAWQTTMSGMTHNHWHMGIQNTWMGIKQASPGKGLHPAWQPFTSGGCVHLSLCAAGSFTRSHGHILLWLAAYCKQQQTCYESLSQHASCLLFFGTKQFPSHCPNISTLPKKELSSYSCTCMTKLPKIPIHVHIKICTCFLSFFVYVFDS